jgi:nitrogen fixation NifU-like protein
MSHGLDDLYKEIILDHYRRPRNKGTLPVPPAQRSEGYNPLCGDEVTVFVEVEDGQVTDLKLEGRGCAISQASASMMSEAVRGRTRAEVETMIGRFRAMLGADTTSSDEFSPDDPASVELMGDAISLQGVRSFPSRVKCATLAWNTLAVALAGEEQFTETEVE